MVLKKLIACILITFSLNCLSQEKEAIIYGDDDLPNGKVVLNDTECQIDKEDVEQRYLYSGLITNKTGNTRRICWVLGDTPNKDKYIPMVQMLEEIISKDKTYYLQHIWPQRHFNDVK